MATAEKTLVKSLPELWELVNQPERMQGLISALVGRAAEVKVTASEPEVRLAWEAAAVAEQASIEIEMEEKGWGTHVKIEVSRDDEAGLDDWLEALMEEFSAHDRRPFQGLV
jgi:hypothetical protein